MANLELLRILLICRKPESVSDNKFRKNVGLYFMDKNGNPRPLPKKKEYNTNEGDAMDLLVKKVGAM